MREGACGKRTAATPKPRPQAYLTLLPGAAHPCRVRPSLSKPAIIKFQMTEEKALTRNRSIGSAVGSRGLAVPDRVQLIGLVEHELAGFHVGFGR